MKIGQKYIFLIVFTVLRQNTYGKSRSVGSFTHYRPTELKIRYLGGHQQWDFARPCLVLLNQEAAARPPPPHLCRGWVGGFEAPIQISCYIFKKCPSGRKRPFFLMARLCSFFALLWFALLFDLCGLRLKIRCYSAFSFLGTLVQFYPKKYPRTLNGHNFRPSMTH